MAHYSVVTPDKTESVILYLIKHFGLPTIRQDLSFYLKNYTGDTADSNGLLDLQFTDNLCSFSYASGEVNRKSSSRSGQIYLKNRNIKYFLKFLHSIHCDRGISNEVTRLDFYNPSSVLAAQCYIGSVYGDMFIFHLVTDAQLGALKNESDIEILTKSEFQVLPIRKNVVKDDSLFNELGLINPKINLFMKRFGSDLLLETPCLEVKMAAMGNDYSFYEPTYKKLTSEDLVSLNAATDRRFFKPLSIVIPAYNSETTLVKTLLSIQSQDLSDEVKSELDVIIVDDGSKQNVFQYIANTFPQLSFRPRIIRMEQNVGLSAARNAGLYLSRYEFVLFMDSDILLAKNYLLEMSVRLQIIPNAIFLSFKENVEMGELVTDDAFILAGLPMSNTKKDKRITRQLKKDQVNHHKIDYDMGVELLNDTNYFRDLGLGRIMGGFDLPAMVVGHNMCIRKEIVKEVGGFSDHFKGWGLEDTYFGARVIAAGNFVIPVLSTGVYHINHLPHSGSEEQRKREYAENIKKYIELIREPLA